ncbi:MAG TPA: putative porin [Gammaproteobacteria bacterium]|nr:putative porin [Gammaproteobacteria bacterium]
MKRTHRALAGWLGLALCAVLRAAHAQEAPSKAPEAPTDAQSLVELRNTVVNLLEGLVQRGILTRQDAQAMVADAQRKAEAETAATRAQQDAEQGAVRVTYVPDVVKDEIEAAVREDVQGAVVEDVVARAKTEGWGVPGALPEWVRNVDVNGVLRVRGEGDYFGEQNAVNTYLNFNAINDAGGIGLAGPDALLNTTEDRARLRARLRLDLAAHVADHITARLAFATGSLDDPISMNATLANYGRRLTFAVQDASIEWRAGNKGATREFDFLAGRFANPFLSTSSLWDVDLSFEGLAGRISFDVFRRHNDGFDPGVFLLLGAFPLEEVQLAADDKWLYAGQIGVNVPIAERSYFRLASAYYAFRNIVGLRNAPDSRLTDYTAPALLARGNTLFDIRNDLNPDTNLFALASDYEIADVVAQLDFGAFGKNRLLFTAEYLENRGYDPLEVEARIGRAADARVKGHQVEVSIGRDIRQAADWRVFAAYRYLERDAVLDAFTDSDFGLGGTDSEGFYLGFDLGVTRNTWLTTKWLSSNEIDGPPLSIDVLQVDFNTRF